MHWQMDSDSDSNSDTDAEIKACLTSACACYAVCVVLVKNESRWDRTPPQNTHLTQRNFVTDILSSNIMCHEMLRMNLDCFHRFVHIFRGTSRLHDTLHCRVEKQVAMFLHNIAFGVRNCPLRRYFQRSSETISYYFNLVLDCILEMQDDFIKIPTTKTPVQIQQSTRFMPHFKVSG